MEVTNYYAISHWILAVSAESCFLCHLSFCIPLYICSLFVDICKKPQASAWGFLDSIYAIRWPVTPKSSMSFVK